MAGKMTTTPPKYQPPPKKEIYRPWMALRGFDGTGNIPRDMDLLRGYLRGFVWISLRFDFRPHSRLGRCRRDDLFVAIGSGSASLCDL